MRIVWDLVGLGIRPRIQTIREVRDHALLHLGEHTDTVEAEDAASAALVDWLRRREGHYEELPVAEAADILPDSRWRQAILDECEPLHEAVFRLAYGDGLPIDEVVHRVGVDAAWVRASQEALRAVGRAVVAEDGLSTEGWTVAQLDAVLGRIANAAGNVCPGPEGLLTDLGRVHAESCPRCSRAHRLIARGFLAPSALFAPEDGILLPNTDVDLLCLQVHPDARKCVRLVIRQFDEHVRIIDGELIFVNAAAVQDIEERLAALTERGMPGVEHLRGVRQRVRGAWGRQAILGPGPLDLIETLQHTEWGVIEGLGDLPDRLPPPPSSLRWYAALVFTMLLALTATTFAWTQRGPIPTFEVTAERDATGVIFDTSDDAYVDVIALNGSLGEPLLHSVAVFDKGQHATGDGRYRFNADADVIVVVTSAAPIIDLAALLAFEADPSRLEEIVQRTVPNAGVVALERPRPLKIGPFTLEPGQIPWR